MAKLPRVETPPYNAFLTLNPNSPSQSTSDAALSPGELRGVLLPLTTPFTASGEVDEVGLRSNIQKWNNSGIHGYVILGSTGERVNLDEGESLRIIETLRSEIPDQPGRLSFIVGAGQQSTFSTTKEIQRIAHAADAVLVITPHFYRAAINQQSLLDHYRSVADASPVPVILYSMPALTGVKIEPETAARLSTHENIIGIKDSSADIDGSQSTCNPLTKTSRCLPEMEQCSAKGCRQEHEVEFWRWVAWPPAFASQFMRQ